MGDDMRGKNNIFIDCQSCSQGFSLIELIIAMVIALVVLSGIYAYCNSQHKAHNIQTRINEMNQNTRVAINSVISEIRMAGYKTGGSTSDLVTQTTTWTSHLAPTDPYSVIIDDTIKIIDGAADPPDDMITIIYADPTPTTLNGAVSEHETSITLNMPSAKVEAAFHVGDIIFIGSGIHSPAGELEFAQVTSVIGNQLGIDTKPAEAGIQGIQRSKGYRSGAEVGLMYVVTYAVFNESNDSSHNHHIQGHPVLARQCNTGSYIDIAEDIESMEISQSGDDIEVTLIGRIPKEEPEYIHPDYGDHYRRRHLTTTVKIRNE